MAREGVGEAIRSARYRSAMTQSELATRLEVTQGTISNWESGRGRPDQTQLEKIKAILGVPDLASGVPDKSDGSSVLAAWLSKAREGARVTVAELSQQSNVSVPTIYNIEAGRAQNPRRRTIELLEKALGKKFEQEFQEEVRKASTVEGVGEFQDFDPHNEKDWPGEAGLYVFYDISDRPVYVGMANNIASRLRWHNDRFWFKRPIVESASFIPVKDKMLRKQVETILIKFLKSNAIINKQGVEREEE